MFSVLKILMIHLQKCFDIVEIIYIDTTEKTIVLQSETFKLANHRHIVTYYT